VAKAKVTLDPRFGRWVVTDGQGHVVARGSKSSPSPSSTPGEPSTTTTTKP
jgi:hypothetical protein